MKNQLKTLTAALLMTAVLCSTQAFASVSEPAHANTTIAAASAPQIVLADDGWFMDPTGPDEGM